MTAKPTAVVVRLPLSEAQKQIMYDYACGGSSMLTTILAIGTPVAGGELEVVGYAAGEDIPLYGDEGIDDTCFTEISLHRQAENDVPLVRQSDAQAALAAAQAEIVRLKLEVCHANDTADAAISEVKRLEEALKGPAA